MNPKEAGLKIIEASRKVLSHKHTKWALIGLGLSSLGVVEWPYAEGSLLKLIDLYPPALLAIPTWEIPVKHGLTEMLQTGEGARELARFVAIDILIGFVAGFLHKGFQKLDDVLITQGEERKRLGIEAIKSNENPSHVFIGPSDLISDLAQAVVASSGKKITKDKPIVGIHLDEKIPPVFGQEMKYHLKADSLNEILGRHAPTTKKELSFIGAAGIDRADEITITCFNPDNAIFYGIQSGTQIPANFVSTLLRSIPEEKLKGKKINVILSGEEYFGQTTPIEAELRQLSKDHSFNLRVIKPESLVLHKIKQRINKIVRNKLDNLINIVLVGEGKTETDELMLDRFKSAIESIKIQNKQIKVTVVSHNRIGDEMTTDRKERKQKLQELLKQSDFNICYGDTDTGTSSAAMLLIKERKAEKKQTLALVERMGMELDFQRADIPYLCVYRLILNKMAEK